MTFRFVVHRSLQQALIEGMGAATAPFENFVSGVPHHGAGAASQETARSAGRPGLLDAFRHYRDLPAGDSDLVGFDVPATPLFIDPFSRRINDDDTSTRLQVLREQASNLWKAYTLVTDRDTIAAYHHARATMDDASCARLSIWLKDVDIVVAPIYRDKMGPAKRAGIVESLPLIRQCARDLNIFSAGTHEPAQALEAWPAFINFIMRAPLFHAFTDGLFELLAALDRADASLVGIHGISIAEFALGLFLREQRLERPLLRIRQVPVLQAKRTHPTAEILEQFDADFYCATYPDVVAARQDPLNHFIHHGFREHREWARCD